MVCRFIAKQMALKITHDTQRIVGGDVTREDLGAGHQCCSNLGATLFGQVDSGMEIGLLHHLGTVESGGVLPVILVVKYFQLTYGPAGIVGSLAASHAVFAHTHDAAQLGAIVAVKDVYRVQFEVFRPSRLVLTGNGMGDKPLSVDLDDDADVGVGTALTGNETALETRTTTQCQVTVLKQFDGNVERGRINAAVAA